MNNVFPFLMNSKPGSAEVEPDAAKSAEFTSPTEYTVVLKDGLKFANGHDLTSSDVKFSFDRQLKIAADNGPSTLLYNLDSTEVKDDTTVVFHLKAENDQIFPLILSSNAGPIVDEEVFSPDAVTTDKEIVDAHAFAGPYDDLELQVQRARAVQGVRRLQGPARRSEDRHDQPQVLRRPVEHEAGRAEG